MPFEIVGSHEGHHGTHGSSEILYTNQEIEETKSRENLKVKIFRFIVRVIGLVQPLSKWDWDQTLKK